MADKQLSQSEIDAVLDQVNDQEELSGGFLPQLGVGTHEVLLSQYQMRELVDKSKVIQADFVVVESTVHAEGEARGWPWFPQAAKWSGVYNRDANKKFIKTCGECIGDKRDSKAIGGDFFSKAQKGRGLRLKVTVTPKINAKTGEQMTTKKGQLMTDANWRVFPQSLADMAEARAQLDEMQGITVAEADAVEPEPTPPPVVEKKASLLKTGSLKKA